MSGVFRRGLASSRYQTQSLGTMSIYLLLGPALVELGLNIYLVSFSFKRLPALPF